MQLYIDTKSTSIEVRNQCFLITKNETQRIISPKRIESIGIISTVTINSSAVKLAAKNEIPIYFFDTTGNVVAELTNPDYLKHSTLRLKQLSFTNADAGRQWAKDLLLLKSQLQKQTIKRYLKEAVLEKAKKLDIKTRITAIDTFEEKIKETSFTLNTFNNTLMAYEGNIAKHYYQCIACFIPPPMQFKTRSRRPAQDYFNAALNYLYGLTYGHVNTAIKSAGLDVYAGVLHKTTYKTRMVFDCIEPIRPIIDRLLIDLCQQQLLNNTHFTPKGNGYWLSKTGKKIILPAFAAYLEQKIRINNRLLSVKNHIFWQARDLKKIIENYDVPHTL